MKLKLKNTAILCSCCETIYNGDKNFKEYEVILMCPKCLEDASKPLFPEKPLFNSLRQLTDILTDLCLFLWQEIEPIFSKFEVIK